MAREDQPQGTESAPQARAALAGELERRRAEVVQRWLERVRAIESSITGPALDDLRSVGEELTRQLADTARAEPSGPVLATSLQELARQLGASRLRSGIDLEDVVRECHALRSAIEEVLRGGAAPPEPLQELLGRTLVEFEAIAVRAHVDAREQTMRRTQSEQVAFITHELGNPLATAMLASAQLRRQMGASSQHMVSLDLLERNLKRLQSLVDGVLMTKRFDAGELRSQPIDVPLGQIMEEALHNSRQRAKSKNLEFRARYDADTLLRVDPQLTISAIQNVVDNAVKFTDQGQVDVSVEDRLAEVVVHVRDACAGIPESTLRTIFEPFQRGASGKPGSGLGLAVARRAVESQGGQIQAESVEGEIGCHFWLTLPKARH